MSSALAVHHQTKLKSVSALIERNREAIAHSLPKHLTLERIVRLAITELRSNPRLLDCDTSSLMSAIVKASQVGLELGGNMGQVYLVPYRDQVQLIIGYRGLLTLVRRSGAVTSFQTHVVYEKDFFELEYGLEEKIKHIPSRDGDPGRMTHVYAIARMRDGGVQYEVMNRAQVDAIRTRSRSSGNGPWVTDYDEMARKTVVRRLFKYLPMSIEMADAMSVDDDTDESIKRPEPSFTMPPLQAHVDEEPAQPQDDPQLPPPAPEQPALRVVRDDDDDMLSTYFDERDALPPQPEPPKASAAKKVTKRKGQGTRLPHRQVFDIAVDIEGLPMSPDLHTGLTTKESKWERLPGVTDQQIEEWRQQNEDTIMLTMLHDQLAYAEHANNIVDACDRLQEYAKNRLFCTYRQHIAELFAETLKQVAPTATDSDRRRVDEAMKKVKGWLDNKAG
jgi:recombination protein RecT